MKRLNAWKGKRKMILVFKSELRRIRTDSCFYGNTEHELIGRHHLMTSTQHLTPHEIVLPPTHFSSCRIYNGNLKLNLEP